MNLHEIPERTARPNPFDMWGGARERLGTAPNLWQDEWLGRNDPWGTPTRTAAPYFWPRQGEVTTWDLAQPGAATTVRTNMRTWEAPTQVSQLVNEVYRLRYELERARIPVGGAERVAFRVSPEEYMELQRAYSTRDERMAIQIDFPTGTMSVMGITVLPSR